MFFLCSNAAAKHNLKTYHELTAIHKNDVRIFNTAAEVKNWEDIVPVTHFFMQPNIWIALENSCPENISFKYALIYYKNEPVGVACFNIIAVQGNNLRGKTDEHTQQNEPFYKKALNYVVQKGIEQLKFKMLVCGNLFLTGNYGFYYDQKRITHAQAFGLLQKAIQIIQQQQIAQSGTKCKAVLIKDFDEQEMINARQLIGYKYQSVIAQPEMVLNIPQKWKSFDDYLNAFSAKYRTRTHAILKKGKAITVREWELEEVEQNQDFIFKHYKQLADKASFNIAYTSATHFYCLKEQFKNEFVVKGFYYDGELVAFSSCFVQKDGHTEAHFIGYNHEVNKNIALYANILYNFVRTAIEYNTKSLALGRTAPEIKSTIGAVPIACNCYMQHTNFVLNKLLPTIFNQFRSDEWIQRHPFKQVNEG